MTVLLKKKTLMFSHKQKLTFVIRIHIRYTGNQYGYERA